MFIRRICIVGVVLIAGCTITSREPTPDDCEERVSALQEEVSQLHKQLQDRDSRFRERLAEILWDDKPALWLCNLDAQEVEPRDWLETNDIVAVVQALNQVHVKSASSPNLEFVGTEGDTVTLRVQNANTLTEGMGTTGAQCYLASVTFSVTSLPGIEYVWLDFEEGNHARPGRYGRASFPYFFPLESAETD